MVEKSKDGKLWAKLRRWTLTNIVVGAIPLITMMWCRGVEAKPRNSAVEYTPELMFLSIMSAVTVMEDMKNIPEDHVSKEDFNGGYILCVIAIVVGAAILGTYFSQAVSTGNLGTMRSMYHASCAMAVIYVILSLKAKWACLKCGSIE